MTTIMTAMTAATTRSGCNFLIKKWQELSKIKLWGAVPLSNRERLDLGGVAWTQQPDNFPRVHGGKINRASCILYSLFFILETVC